MRLLGIVSYKAGKANKQQFDTVKAKLCSLRQCIEKRYEDVTSTLKSGVCKINIERSRLS